jgi:hypothetical protein
MENTGDEEVEYTENEKKFIAGLKKRAAELTKQMQAYDKTAREVAFLNGNIAMQAWLIGQNAQAFDDMLELHIHVMDGEMIEFLDTVRKRLGAIASDINAVLTGEKSPTNDIAFAAQYLYLHDN